MIKAWPCWTIRSSRFLFAAQSTILPVIVLAGWMWRLSSVPHPVEGSIGLLLSILTCQTCFYFSGLDRLITSANLQAFLVKTLKALAAVLVVTSILFYVFPRLSPGYLAICLTALLCTLLAVGMRPLLRTLVRRRTLVESLLIVGTDELATDLCRELGAAPVCVSVNCDELRNLADREGISRIVVAQPDGPDRQRLVDSLIDCKLRGVAIEDAVAFYERLTGKIWVKELQPEWLVYSDGFRPSKFYPPLKRLTDIMCAFLLILLTAPLFLLIAFLIKMDSPGPVLFRQERVGMFGQPFTLYKFRSMRQDAEAATGPVWAAKEDNRATRLGRLLRQYRLDEIPQAFNVLRGEMSLIGPRPERECFVRMLEDRIRYYALRHYVKPGITGWAQVIYPYGASVEDAIEKLQYDLYYIKHMALRLDFLVLLKTFRVVLFGRGR